MKYGCLSREQLVAILQGDALANQVNRCELHLSECDSCSRIAESLAADQALWGDIAASLRQQPTVAVGALVDTEQATALELGQLQTLLGPTDDPSMLGRIGSYEIIGLLGRGGMGAVFKALDPSLNRYVAIKLLLPHTVVNGAARARFAREAQAAAAVVDDHVMPILSVDSWQGMPYLVMPYYRGCSLQQRISDQGALGLREVLRIAMQAARALAAAHEQGIIHRDVKPANIFLDSGVERARLMDFGLARAVDDATLTHSGSITGTPQFMSPEQVCGESLDPRSDLFSLGSVIYATCTGQSPFRAETSYAVLRRITDHEPRSIRDMNPDIPDWLERVVQRLMAKSPSDRFQSAREVAEILESCLAHVQRPTVNRLPPAVTRGRRFTPSNVESRRVVDALIATTRGLSCLACALCAAAVSLRSRASDLWSQSLRWQRRSGTTTGYLVTSLRKEYPMKLLLLLAVTVLGLAAMPILYLQQAESANQDQKADMELPSQTTPQAPAVTAKVEAAKLRYAPITELLRDQSLSPIERAVRLRAQHRRISQAATHPEVSAQDQIRALKLIAGNRVIDSVDTRFPIRIKGADGFTDDRMLRHGETKLFSFPELVMETQWQCGDNKPEGIDDIEPFNYLLVEWIGGKLIMTTYRQPAAPPAAAPPPLPSTDDQSTRKEELDRGRVEVDSRHKDVVRLSSSLTAGIAGEDDVLHAMQALERARRRVTELEFLASSDGQLKWNSELGSRFYVTE